MFHGYGFRKPIHGAFSIILAGMLICVVGCCKPSVMHSMLSPEAKEIQVWLIDLGIDSFPADTSAAMVQLRKDFVSELANEEFYRDYLAHVGREMTALGYNIAAGPVGEGIVRIKPDAQKRTHIFLGPDSDQRLIEWNRMEQDDTPSRDDRSSARKTGEGGTEYVKPIFRETDAVRNVYIEIIGHDGKFLGSVDITGGKVKAEFVAKVLDRLIREGEW